MRISETYRQRILTADAQALSEIKSAYVSVLSKLRLRLNDLKNANKLPPTVETAWGSLVSRWNAWLGMSASARDNQSMLSFAEEIEGWKTRISALETAPAPGGSATPVVAPGSGPLLNMQEEAAKASTPLWKSALLGASIVAVGYAAYLWVNAPTSRRARA
jgi:hypothetical protein